MNFRKVLSAVLAGTMSLSMVNGVLAVTEGTGADAIILDTFDTKTNGWNRIYRGATSFSTAYDHTGNGGGSLKFEAKTYGLNYGSSDCGARKVIPVGVLEEGKTYKVTAWIYGERVKGKTTDLGTVQDNAAVAFFDNTTAIHAGNFADNIVGDCITTELKQGEWTKLESYFVAQGTSKYELQIKVPYYYDNKNFPDNYDIYYIDDISFEEQTNADILHYTENYDTFNNAPYLANRRSFNRLNRNLEIKAGGKYIDLSGTQRHIKLGETAALNAFIVEAVAGQAASTMTRVSADNQYISVTTNEDFLTYANGVFTPVNTGVSVATVTYNDGSFTDTKSVLITVYDDGAEMCNAETMDTWIHPNITDPLDSNNDIYVGTTKNYVNGGIASAQTPISANNYTVISYRSYNPGGNVDTERMGDIKIKVGTNEWLINGGGGTPLYIQGTGMSQTRPRILTGWNNIDYVFEPVAENVSNVTIYFNGEPASTALGVTMPEANFVCELGNGVLIDDFKAVTVSLEPKISTVDLPAEGETLSTLGDFNITFASAMTVADGGIKILDSDNNEIAIRLFVSDDNRVYRVKPYGGFAANSTYRLVFDTDKISLASNPAVKLSSSTGEYTFTTDTTEVSDVIGRGYTLLNAQHDMIGNGNYTLKNGAYLVEGTNELKASYVDNDVLFPEPFSFTAEDIFTKDTEKADRYIVEFDAKVDMNDVAANTKFNEWLRVEAVDINGVSGPIGYMGTDPWSDGYFTYRYSTPDPIANPDEGSLRSMVYDKALGHDRVQLFGDYMHFKYVYEFGQNNENGNVKQTAYLTDTTGTTYTYGPVYGFVEIGSKFSREFEPVAVKRLYWSSRQRSARDLSIKNVSMYALRKTEDADESVEVYEFMVLDGNDNVVTAIEGGNSYNVSCKVANNSYLGDSLTVLAGIFTTDNQLIAVKTATTAAPVGTEDTIVFDTLDLSSAPTDGTYVLKVFCWNSLDAGVPVTEVAYPLAQ